MTDRRNADRRTVLKALPATVLGSSLVAGAASADQTATASVQEPEDAWRMVGYDPANTFFNSVATGPEPPVDVAWRVSGLPGIVLPPAVVGDAVYAGTSASDPPTGDLRAFSTDQGTLRWLFVPSAPGVGIPAVVDGTIYIGGSDGNVNAVDVDTEELHWTFETEGVPTFPKVTSDTIYMADSAMNLYAVDAATGAERWRFTEPTDAVTLTVTVANDTVYAGTGGDDTTVYAVDAASGDERWRFEAATDGTNLPVVAHDTVYVSSADTNLYALDPATGEEEWRFEEASGPFGSPAVDDETVYVRNGESTLVAIDAMTGDQRWQFEAATARIFTPMVDSESVYISSVDTNMYAVDTASGEERWRFEAATKPLASPVVVGDRLYVGTFTGTLYAVT